MWKDLLLTKRQSKQTKTQPTNIKVENNIFILRVKEGGVVRIYIDMPLYMHFIKTGKIHRKLIKVVFASEDVGTGWQRKRVDGSRIFHCVS